MKIREKEFLNDLVNSFDAAEEKMFTSGGFHQAVQFLDHLNKVFVLELWIRIKTTFDKKKYCRLSKYSKVDS